MQKNKKYVRNRIFMTTIMGHNPPIMSDYEARRVLKSCIMTVARRCLIISSNGGLEIVFMTTFMGHTWMGSTLSKTYKPYKCL